MKNRIKKVMDDSGLSASKFADKIGVPRSGLSHVLSGRNKPSLDYVLKILNAFPDLDPSWLLKGQKSSFMNSQISKQKYELENDDTSVSINSSLDAVNKKMEGQADKLVEKMAKVEPEEFQARKTPKQSNKKAKSVSRIVYFFSDGSFEEYFPSK